MKIMKIPELENDLLTKNGQTYLKLNKVLQ